MYACLSSISSSVLFLKLIGIPFYSSSDLDDLTWTPSGKDLEGKNCAVMLETKQNEMKLKGIECNNQTNKKARKKYICKRPADLLN